MVVRTQVRVRSLRRLAAGRTEATERDLQS
jgi:hypothetical protein